MNLIQQLQNLGIEKKQAQVYLACLELGSATVQELARQSGIKRTSVYNFLDEMKKVGLINEIKQDNRILITPEDPQVLLKNMQNKTKKMEKILPELRGIFNLPGHKPKVRYYEGIGGIKKAYAEMVSKKETIYGYSDYEKMFLAFEKSPEKDWPWHVPEERVKKKIFFYNIAKDGQVAREVKRKDKQQLRQTKLVKGLELDTEINIYGNFVLMISFRRPYTAVIIEDRAIAMSMKSIWQMSWNNIEKKK